MSGGQVFAVATAREAVDVTERFNAFHDGFISRLGLRSDDSFPEVGVHTVTGPLRIEIEFAHYNYDDGAPPPQRRIRADFERVTELRLDFTGAETDWPITSFELAGDAGGGLLEARLVQPRYDGSEWSHERAMQFRFETAVFEELPDVIRPPS